MQEWNFTMTDEQYEEDYADIEKNFNLGMDSAGMLIWLEEAIETLGDDLRWDGGHRFPLWEEGECDIDSMRVWFLRYLQTQDIKQKRVKAQWNKFHALVLPLMTNKHFSKSKPF